MLQRIILICLYVIYPGVKLIEMLATFYSRLALILSIFKFLVIFEKIFLLLGLFIIFGVLYHLLHTKHKFEFYRNRNQMLSFFFLNVLLLLITIVMVSINSRNAVGETSYCNWKRRNNVIDSLVNFVSNVLAWAHLMQAYLMLYIKSPYDIL